MSIFSAVRKGLPLTDDSDFLRETPDASAVLHNHWWFISLGSSICSRDYRASLELVNENAVNRLLYNRKTLENREIFEYFKRPFWILLP